MTEIVPAVPHDGPPPWAGFDYDQVLDDMGLLCRRAAELAIERGHRDPDTVYRYVVAVSAMAAMCTAQRFDKRNAQWNP